MSGKNMFGFPKHRTKVDGPVGKQGILAGDDSGAGYQWGRPDEEALVDHERKGKPLFLYALFYVVSRQCSVFDLIESIQTLSFCSQRMMQQKKKEK